MVWILPLNFPFSLFSSPSHPSSWLSRLRNPGSTFLRVCFSALNAGPVGLEVRASFVWTVLWNWGWLLEQDKSFFFPLHCGSQGFPVLVIGTDCSSLVFWQILLLGLSKACSTEANLYSLWRAMSTTFILSKIVLPEKEDKIITYAVKLIFRVNT